MSKVDEIHDISMIIDKDFYSVLDELEDLKSIYRNNGQQYNIQEVEKIEESMKKSLKLFSTGLKEYYVDVLFYAAQINEILITEDIKRIISNSNGQLTGLEYRLKTRDSLSEKINNRGLNLADNSIVNPEQWNSISKTIKDCVRFTALLPIETFVEDFLYIKKLFESIGYQFVHLRNTFGNTNNTYRGINSNLFNPNKYKFELQFHTNESFDAKHKGHYLYEIIRNPQQYSQMEIQNAVNEQSIMFSQVPIPANIDQIKEI